MQKNLKSLSVIGVQQIRLAAKTFTIGAKNFNV